MKISDPQQNTQFIIKATQLVKEWEYKLLMVWLTDSPNFTASSVVLGQRIGRTKRQTNRILKSLVTKGLLIDTGRVNQNGTKVYEPNLSILSSNTPPTTKKKKKPSKVDLSVSCDKICEEVDSMTDEEAEKQAGLYNRLFNTDDLDNLHNDESFQQKLGI